MKTLNEWFREYAESHQNPVNQRIHTVCVPAIFISVLGLVWALPNLNLTIKAAQSISVPWIAPTVALISLYYLRLDKRLGFLMIAVMLVSVAGFWLIERIGISIFWLSLVVFILAWIGQAYGHKIEGKNPSFFTNLFFLLIGPVWILDKMLRHRT